MHICSLDSDVVAVTGSEQMELERLATLLSSRSHTDTDDIVPQVCNYY